MISDTPHNGFEICHVVVTILFLFLLLSSIFIYMNTTFYVAILLLTTISALSFLRLLGENTTMKIHLSWIKVELLGKNVKFYRKQLDIFPNCFLHPIFPPVAYANYICFIYSCTFGFANRFHLKLDICLHKKIKFKPYFTPDTINSKGIIDLDILELKL